MHQRKTKWQGGLFDEGEGCVKNKREETEGGVYVRQAGAGRETTALMSPFERLATWRARR